MNFPDPGGQRPVQSALTKLFIFFLNFCDPRLSKHRINNKPVTKKITKRLQLGNASLILGAKSRWRKKVKKIWNRIVNNFVIRLND